MEFEAIDVGLSQQSKHSPQLPPILQVTLYDSGPVGKGRGRGRGTGHDDADAEHELYWATSRAYAVKFTNVDYMRLGRHTGDDRVLPSPDVVYLEVRTWLTCLVLPQSDACVLQLGAKRMVELDAGALGALLTSTLQPLVDVVRSSHSSPGDGDRVWCVVLGGVAGRFDMCLGYRDRVPLPEGAKPAEGPSGDSRSQGRSDPSGDSRSQGRSDLTSARGELVAVLHIVREGKCVDGLPPPPKGERTPEELERDLEQGVQVTTRTVGGPKQSLDALLHSVLYSLRQAALVRKTRTQERERLAAAFGMAALGTTQACVTCDGCHTPMIARAPAMRCRRCWNAVVCGACSAAGRHTGSCTLSAAFEVSF